MYQLVIVEDHPLFLEKLVEIFNSTGQHKVVFTANNGAELLEKIKSFSAEIDLFILDINLPNLDGISLAKQLKKLIPNAKVAAFSQFYSKALETSAKSAGIMKIISKNVSKKAFLDSIDCLLNPIKPAKPLYKNQNLSERQLQVISKIAEGKTVKQISEELFVSAETIKSHKKEIMRKLDISNLVELIKYAATLNL